MSGNSTWQLDRGLVKKLSSIFLKLPGNMAARVYASAGFTHNSAGNWLTVNTFDTVRYDTGANRDYTNGFWNVANPERLTATHAGFYIIFCHVVWDASDIGERGLIIYNQDASLLAMDTRVTTSVALYTGISIATGPVRMVPGNYVYAKAYQTSGGNLNILAGSATNWNRCDFGLVRVP